MQITTSQWLAPDGQTGYESYILTHADCQLITLPERGGKIVSLRHLPTNREWLWLNQDLAWLPPHPTDSYVALHDLGGWDECFPTVAATTVDGQRWPDHGDLWWREWTSTTEAGTLKMEAAGEQYRFARQIVPAARGFRLNYAVRNQGDAPFPYLWCAHPLFCIDPPLTLELPGRPDVRLGNQSPYGEMGEIHRWPTIQGRTFTELGKPSQQAVKLFVAAEEGAATLIGQDQTQLCLRWALDQLPVLGLWINEGGWSGAGTRPYCNLGVEPANGAPDDLAIAMREWDCYRLLEPGATHEWWVEVEFIAAPS
jgi:galactose mutarotase-like enzyme